MKNSLALVINEQEREYIRNIYGTKILTEQEVDQPEDIKDFQDWMDGNHPNWVNGKNLNQGGGYGDFGPKTSAAWSSWKSDYLDSKKDNVDAPVDNTKYYYNDNGKTSSVQTKEQIDELISNGTITPDTLIYSNKSKAWAKASTYDNLDVVPPPPPSTGNLENKKDKPEVKNSDPSPSYTKFSGSSSSKNAPIDAFGDETTCNEDGLKSWYKGVYKQDLPLDATTKVFPDKHYAIVSKGGKNLTFTYNDMLKTFNIPRETTKKETKVLTKANAPKPTENKDDQAANQDTTTDDSSTTTTTTIPQ